MKQIFVSFALLSLCSCLRFERATPISKVKANPEVYRSQSVTIRGEVTDRLKMTVMGGSTYVIQDKTGSIKVRTTWPLPTEGSILKVRGHLTDAVKVGGLRMGNVLMEEARMEMKK